MNSVSRRTFKTLVDDVLLWTGDKDDQATMRELAKNAVRYAHELRLTRDRYSFMVFPRVQTFTTVSGQDTYSLHESFLSPVYFKNRTTGKPLRTVPFARSVEFRETTAGSMEYVSLHGMSRFQAQPGVNGVISVTGVGGDAAKTITLVGETSGGVVEETVNVNASSTNSFLAGGLIDIIKNGDSWTGNVTLTDAGATTLLVLAPSVYGRQFKQLQSLRPIGAGDTIEYQFIRQPKTLQYDNDIPDIPYPFDQILALDALVRLSGFTRASANEIREWKNQIEELENQLAMHYQDGLASDSEVNYSPLVER